MTAPSPPRVAIVTGAARRLGLAIAHRLARDGFGVLLHASPGSLAEAEREADRLRREGARARSMAADLADPGSAARIVEAAGAFGPLGLLVNNASVFERDDAGAPDPALLDRHMAVNVRAPVLLAARFADGAEPGASVVNILDQRVLRPNPLYLSYTLSKAALATATRTLAQGFAPRGIRVNAVLPGPTLPSRDGGPAGFAREVEGLPLRRAVLPEEIAEAVLFLSRARSVAGTLLPVDGGQHLGWETPDVLGYDRAPDP